MFGTRLLPTIHYYFDDGYLESPINSASYHLMIANLFFGLFLIFVFLKIFQWRGISWFSIVYDFMILIAVFKTSFILSFLFVFSILLSIGIIVGDLQNESWTYLPFLIVEGFRVLSCILLEIIFVIIGVYITVSALFLDYNKDTVNDYKPGDESQEARIAMDFVINFAGSAIGPFVILPILLFSCYTIFVWWKWLIVYKAYKFIKYESSKEKNEKIYLFA
uniref:Uncharacterized protein n=1 Tax=Panagrolaimus sp. JU765 TaxID=591449 RepID=A0AC34RKY0_9BILA